MIGKVRNAAIAAVLQMPKPFAQAILPTEFARGIARMPKTQSRFGAGLKRQTTGLRSTAAIFGLIIGSMCGPAPCHSQIVIAQQTDGSVSAGFGSPCNNGCSNVVFGSQVFVPNVTAALGSIEVFTSNFGTSSRNPDTNGCFLNLYNQDTGAFLASSDNGFSGYGCAGDLTFSFNGSEPLLTIGTHYRWDFVFGTQNFTGISFFGSATDAVGGSFSLAPLANAKFTALSAIPTPTALHQFSSDGLTDIPPGGIASAGTVVFIASFPSSFAEPLELQVEARPTGISFSGNLDSGITTSSFVGGGGPAKISKIMSDGLWHWRARFLDAGGNGSNWASFNSTGATDFQIETTPPSSDPTIIAEQLDGSITSGTNTNCSNACPDVVVATQVFAPIRTAQLASIELFTANFSTSSLNWYTNGCAIQLFNADTNTLVAQSDNGFAGPDCAGDIMFLFTNSTPTLQVGTHYRWDFHWTGNYTGLDFEGSPDNVVDGIFTPGPVVNAKFIAHGVAVPLGTISVTTNNVSASFAITDDKGHNFNGTGTTFVHDAPAGTYTITFGAIPGYTAPQPQTASLAGGSTLTFTGTYVIATGTIAVSTNSTSATFTITGPTTYSGTGQYSTFANVPPGSYSIIWGPVGGTATPASQTQTLFPGNTVTFTGIYTPASVQPMSLTFPDTSVGGVSSAQPVTLKNLSNSALIIGSVVASPNFAVGTSTCGTSLAIGATCRINVKFGPTVTGPITGTLTINNATPAGSETVMLSGNGVAQLALTPGSVEFGDVALPNTSAPISITLTNNTNHIVTFQASVKPAATFLKTSSTCGTSLNPLGACTIYVAFHPSTVSSYSGALTLSETGPNGSQSVPLSGNGISGGIVMSAPKLSLPDTNVGATSSASQLTLTNETGGSVTMGSIIASQDFVVSSNTCGTTLISAQKCSVYMKFHPSNAGAATGTLTINEAVPAATQVVALTGTGLNLLPKLTREYPKSGAVGAPGFVINVYGSNFVTSSVVQWNGNARPTNFITSGQLQAQISAGDIDIASQNIANVTVVSPAPGGGTSVSLAFAINPNGIACNNPNVVDPSPADCHTALVEDTTTDQQPLGTRIPLILIHGINGNADSGKDDISSPNRIYFLSFLNYFNYSGFQQKYKLYRFHYESNNNSTWEIGRSLRNQIDVITSGDRNWEVDTSTKQPKQILIVAHSMGGLVAREYMNEHNTNSGHIWAGKRAGYRVNELITLATPHHGTPVANGFVRITGQTSGIGALPYLPDWSTLFTAVDVAKWGSWQFLPGSETTPNRSDLRFDNFNAMWSVAYTTDGTPIGYSIFEHNALLDAIDHTFDGKIYAYYGYIGASADVSNVGLLGPGVALPGLPLPTDGLESLLIQRSGPTGNMDSLLDVTGVILQRIWTANYDLSSSAYPVTYIDNDGVVPRSSAAFDGASLLGQVECPGYDHFQMIGDNAFAQCKTGYTVLRSLVDTLGVPPRQ